jgi:tagatose 6-phosphate kinase
VIGVVCLNPALDVTHHVPAVDWSGVNRPDEVHARPGGKGLNVARTLHALGTEVLVMGLAGGTTGQAVTAALAALAVPSAFTWVRGETRRTFTVVDGRTGDAALFNEPGPRIAADGYAEFRARYASVLGGCAAVVLAGSLPPGLPAGCYAELTALAAGAGVPVLLDAHGEALRLGAAAGPAIVKPNLAELEAFAGRPLSRPAGSGPAGSGPAGSGPAGSGPAGSGPAGWRPAGSGPAGLRPAGLRPAGTGPAVPDRQAVAAAAGELRAAGPQAVVVSLGPDGLHADTPDGGWQAVPPAVVAGNATGAGDAAAAGLAQGLALGQPWEERLRHAVALGTAAALAPVAGEFSPADYATVRAGVTVTRADDAHDVDGAAGVARGEGG